MSTIYDMIVDDPEEADRLARYAIKENPNLSNFEEFEQAFLKAFNSPEGEHLLSFLNDDESKILFKTAVVRNQIKNNLDNDEEYQQVYGESEDYDVIRAVPKGQSTKSRDITVINVSKPVSVKPYTKRGRNIMTYSRGYTSWTPAQQKYLISQKSKDLPTKEIIFNYNQQFKDNQRSSSSIKTKLYRA